MTECEVTDFSQTILRQAKSPDWPAIKALLFDAGLPVEDLNVNKLSNFMVADDAGTVRGAIGLERKSTVGLLRSLVLQQDTRGFGLGSRLVNALEITAEASGITELWLLTIDAQNFFERRGYEIVERNMAPDSIRSTAEFAGLCPDSAHLMKKNLG